jgi:colanic acid biosynthesis protein WcaH
MLDNQTFLTVIESTPLVSIDLILFRNQSEILLGLRNNKPAQNFWFVPGGRIFKNEKIYDALLRIAEKELGLGTEIKIGNLTPHWLGLFEHFHFYTDFGDAGISTHYVVLGYKLDVSDDFLLPRCFDDQHTEFCWWQIKVALKSPFVHKFTKEYFFHLLNNIPMS